MKSSLGNGTDNMFRLMDMAIEITGVHMSCDVRWHSKNERVSRWTGGQLPQSRKVPSGKREIRRE
jgi:hypothetical protein